MRRALFYLVIMTASATLTAQPTTEDVPPPQVDAPLQVDPRSRRWMPRSRR